MTPSPIPLDIGPDAVVLPPNACATPSRHGRRGRPCARGFPEQGAGRVAVALPDDARFDDRGERWTCDRGFRAARHACTRVETPANGSLSDDSGGPGWTCERGFRTRDASCARIVPAGNAFLTDETYGEGRRYVRGSRTAAGARIEVAPPCDAHRSADGDGWSRDPPFLRQREGCVSE